MGDRETLADVLHRAAGTMTDLHAQNVGARYLQFGNGRSETVYAVEVYHEPTGDRWEQIWVLRSSEMADRVADALNRPEGVDVEREREDAIEGAKP